MDKIYLCKLIFISFIFQNDKLYDNFVISAILNLSSQLENTSPLVIYECAVMHC